MVERENVAKLRLELRTGETRMYDYASQRTRPKYCAACTHATRRATTPGRARCDCRSGEHLALIPRDCRDFEPREVRHA